MRQKLIEPKGEIEKFTIIVGDFNTLPQQMVKYERENKQVSAGSKQHNQPVESNWHIWNTPPNNIEKHIF